MCPIYEYEHPETGEIFEDIRLVKNRKKPFVAPDGVKCPRREVPAAFTGWKGDREVFEMDKGHYVKEMKPKYVKFRDGHRELYDPTKHC